MEYSKAEVAVEEENIEVGALAVDDSKAEVAVEEENIEAGALAVEVELVALVSLVALVALVAPDTFEQAVER